jgi:hypothetical protein
MKKKEQDEVREPPQESILFVWFAVKFRQSCRSSSTGGLFPALVFAALLLFFLSPGLSAGPRGDSVETVIASTSLVAAIARAGGAPAVKVLAPAELRHPPEYDLKPSDLMAASRGKLILYAGWEIFAKKLADTAGSAGIELVTVNTGISPPELVQEARRISELLGTGPAFEAWREGFEILTEDTRREVMAAYPRKRAVVHYDLIPLARWLGFEIAGEYGPAEPSPQLVLRLGALSPDLVIDNYHNPAGKPIAEAAGASLAELIFFPGKNGSRSLEDLFRYNRDLLIEAAGGGPPR